MHQWYKINETQCKDKVKPIEVNQTKQNMKHTH